MASRIMDWWDSLHEMTQEDLTKALSDLEHVPEDDVRGWIDRAGIDEDYFAPLDDNVKVEVERLRGVQVQQLTARWQKDWSPSLPVESELSEALYGWRSHLDKRCVGDYCAAAAALIRSFLLDASAETGRIERLRDSPTLLVFAKPGSVLALEQGFEQGEEGSVRIGPGQFGHQIALRCGEPGAWGELAWRSLASSLAVMEADNVLPRLEVRLVQDGTTEFIEIKLEASYE